MSPSANEKNAPWLAPGRNCWRVETAGRFAVLMENAAYFEALQSALAKAKRSVVMLGWQFDPRTRLDPETPPNDHQAQIGHQLRMMVKARPELDIRLLIWKSSLPIAATQEFFPHKARKWFEGSRVRFRLDDQVPFGACHHQKIVVIDDRLAFCGGGDIGVDRWDTPGHLDVDFRRIMPDQECHAPRHEVMMMVDGAAARALGDHFRERWRLGCDGEEMAPPPDAGGDPWPDHVPPHLQGVDICISRTAPPWRGRPAIDELRRLTLAAIAEAKETIYLENQYFTSPVITEALARRLTEPDGPEVVIVTTGESPSWFDKMAMDNARGAMVWRLRAADVFGRFRAFYPRTAAGSTIIVHSKTSFFDDRLARVGSANLNNRSFGFDTEIELAVQARSDEERLTLAAMRDRLVGHFLGYTGDAVTKARADHGGLVPAIDALNREDRLREIHPSRHHVFAEFVAAYHLGDPASPEDSWRPWRRRQRLFEAARRLSAPS